MNFTQTQTLLCLSVSGITGSLSLLLTLFLIYRHMKHWTNAQEQSYIVRILLMVPVYSIASFLSLLFSQHIIYFNLVRDWYEAFVLYQFFSLLVHYFDTVSRDTLDMDNDAETGHYLSTLPSRYHPFPCCCLPLIKPGPTFLRIAKQCILQYVGVKLVLALIAIVLEVFGLYGEGGLAWDKGYLWIMLILNISISISLYALLLFYDVIHKVIKEYRPLAKLLAIKVLIFFIFWQSLLIEFLHHIQWISIQTGILNNTLVCVEMFFLAIANLSIFHYANYRDQENPAEWFSPRLAWFAMTLWIFNPKDIVDDTKDAFLPRGSA